jgi:rhodanese-related sulfurtransferase
MTKVQSTVAAILERAVERARAAGLPYRGALTPSEAHQLVAAGAARLIDVRSSFEWDFVGHFPGSTLIEWKRLGGVPNPDFIAQLGAQGARDQNYLFMCRSGARSHAAAVAASESGYANAFNVLEGFEGDLDEEQHRGARNGWRHAGLPWIQG